MGSVPSKSNTEGLQNQNHKETTNKAAQEGNGVRSPEDRSDISPELQYVGSGSMEQSTGIAESVEDQDAPEEEHFIKRSAQDEYTTQLNEQYDQQKPVQYNSNGIDIELEDTGQLQAPGIYENPIERGANQDITVKEYDGTYHEQDGQLDDYYQENYQEGLYYGQSYQNTHEQTEEYAEGEVYDQGEGYNEGDDYEAEEGDNDEVGESQNYKQGYNEGYNIGYTEGHTAGYNSGYDEAYTIAYKSYQDQLTALLPTTKYRLSYDTLPKNAKKYWKQRYSLFKKFDQGIYMTSELWYSVTPESLATFVAKFVQACNPDLHTIVDVCCGGGGNTIQFARRFDKVIGIDINDDNLYCTSKNCEVYNVLDKVELRQADWTNMIDTDYYKYLQERVDLVFCSPPWGGPAYKGKDYFDLDLLQPMPIKELLISFFKISPNVVLFLPRNSNLVQLADVTRELLGDEAKCRVLYTYCDGFIKGVIALWGEKFMPESYTPYQPDVVHPGQETETYKSRNQRDDDPNTAISSNEDIEMDY